jgi:hypothetical protein
VANPANSALNRVALWDFSLFSGIGTRFELYLASARKHGRRPRKGRIQMSGQSTFNRTLVALAAALLASTVAVSAAVAPAQVAGSVSVSARA